MKHTLPQQTSSEPDTSGNKASPMANPFDKEQAPAGNPFQAVPAAANPLQFMAPAAPKPVNTTGLPDQLKQGMETLSGYSLDDVTVHYNSDKPLQLQALAFAQGPAIHLAPGQEQHLAHEAWHVVQQKQGRVQPTRQLKGGTPLNDEPGLEAEADHMGQKASSFRLPGAEGPLLVSQLVSSAPAIQRVPVNCRVGSKTYEAEYEDGWLKIPSGGHILFIYYSKNVKQQGGYLNVGAHLEPFINSWFSGNLILYRGVNRDHAAYQPATQGLLPPKPSASLEIPEFTSDSSQTKFIPFSTDREIAVMASKTNPREDAQHNLGQEAADANEVLGVVVRVQVGTGQSIGIFSEGEIQVLNPPAGRAVPVTGITLQYGNRLDRQALDEEAILHHLHEQLDDPVWSRLGKGFFGAKTPDGIERMQEALATNNWKQVLRIAEAKQNTQESNRHPQVSSLYEKLTSQILIKARNEHLL